MLKKILCTAGVMLMTAFSTAKAGDLYCYEGPYDAAYVARIKADAERGDAEAQCRLAECSYWGYCEGIPRDYSICCNWLEKAAEQGDTWGQVWLGEMYEEGKGVQQDFVKARELFEKSAAQGNPFAQFTLGIWYFYGKGVVQNKVTAKEWFGKACDNGHQRGCVKYRELNEAGY